MRLHINIAKYDENMREKKKSTCDERDTNNKRKLKTEVIKAQRILTENFQFEQFDWITNETENKNSSNQTLVKNRIKTA